MTMFSSSKSTLMMNCIVAISTRTLRYPHPLYDEGFVLDMIEPRFLLLNGMQVAPDVQLNKHNEYLLFFECKDGYADPKQIDGYKALSADDIKRSRTTNLSTTNLNHDISYMSSVEKEKKIIESLGDAAQRFPLLILNNTSIVFSANSCKFKKAELNKIFENFSFPENPPQSFIPFMPYDSDEIIIANTLQHLLSKSGCDFSTYDLLKELIPSLDAYSQEGLKELIGRVDNLLKFLTTHEVMSEFLTHTNGKYRLDINQSIRRFQRVVRKVVDNYEKIIKEKAQSSGSQPALTSFPS